MPFQQNIPKSTLVSLAVGTLSLGAYIAYQKQKATDEPNRKDEIVVPMLPFETSPLMMENVRAISSLTWYSGDVNDVLPALKERVQLILEANPWLMGRMATRKGKTSIVYSAKTTSITEEELDGIFTVTTDIHITKKLPYRDLVTAVEPLLVKKGNDLLNKKDECFFRISIIPESGGRGFALITSLAHCVGDGYTYYTVHNMLSIDSPITTLNADRKLEMTERILTALGGKDQDSFNPNAGFILRFIRGIIASKLAGPLSTSVKLFLIPDEWITEQKKEALSKSKDSFVSTNDVITSNLFQTMECDQGIMALNFRNKIENCNVDDAGNYFQQLILRPLDYQSPTKIRSIVQELQYGGNRKPQTSPMTSFEHLKSQLPFGAISNWCSFSKPVTLSTYKQELHIPLLPTDPLSVPSRFTSGLFLFRPDSTKKVAALFAGHPDVFERLSETGMVGDDVSTLLSN